MLLCKPVPFPLEHGPMQDNLSDDLSHENHPAGYVICQIGDPGDCAYLVESGSIEVLSQSGRAIAVIKAGEIFGEVALLDQLPRTATLRTLEPTALLRIDRSHVQELLKRTDPVIRHLLTLLLERFRYRSANSILRTGNLLTPLMDRLRPRNEDDTPPQSSQQICWHEGDAAATNLTLILAQDLVQAMKNGQLTLAYQPLLSLPDRKLLGFEALIRWYHPILGSIAPTKLIPLAEKTGMIQALGLWVLNRAITDWPALRQHCEPSVKQFISINLSAPELASAELAITIDQLLATANIPHDQLQLELVETTLIEDMSTVSACLDNLTARGIRIALDDFGTGYASFEYLSSLPISCLKIDQAFIRDAANNSRRREVVQTAINLAHSLGMTTIGEGIEDEATAELLSELGCDVAQGYFFGRPMPKENISDWVKESRASGRLAQASA